MPPKKVKTTEPEYEDEASVEKLDEVNEFLNNISSQMNKTETAITKLADQYEESTKHNKALLDAILSLKTRNEAIVNAIQNLGNQPSIVKNETRVQSTQKVKKKTEENQEDLYDQDMQHDKPLYYQASGNVSSAKTLHEQCIYSYKTILNPPVGSPGLSDKKGKIMLVNPFVKYEKRNWTSHNSGSPYTDWLRNIWSEMLLKNNLTLCQLSARNANKPFSWSMRAASADLFRDDFSIVSDFIKAQHPTWPMVVEAVLQILHSSENGNAALDAFARFRSEPSNDEKTLDFLKRMVKAYGTLPTMDWQSSEAANTIRFTLNTHVTQIAEDLKRDDNFYPIYRALELAVVYAEKQSLIYSQLASRPQGTIPKQQFIDPLRPNTSDKINDVPPSSVFNNTDPILTVNAATEDTICYNCGIKVMGTFEGHIKNYKTNPSFTKFKPNSKKSIKKSFKNNKTKKIRSHAVTVEDPDNEKSVDINLPHEYQSDAVSDYEDVEYETVSEDDE
ncbi:hypothetical protein GcC1_010001 [Golovinomyces cichoracearum]|uniref:Uncharacterized protein n=1 Tax=Golovinomyces cichoracearum TaxID=62708 RepID=A0A420J7Q2_9PEZI|nr:hypothetical protein GcC1_010001 [Golovinomyces cichoracearum]